MTEPIRVVGQYNEPVPPAGVFFGKKKQGATCPICNKELFDKGNLKSHLKIDHSYLT